MKDLLVSPFFWIMAFTVDVLFKVLVKPFLKKVFIPGLNKILPAGLEIKTPAERRNIYWFFIVLLSIVVFWLMHKYDTVKTIEDSLVLSAAWLAIMSVLIYDVGVNFFWSILKRALQKGVERSLDE